MPTEKTAQKCPKGNIDLRARYFCFTSFSEKPPEFDSSRMSYLCFSPEKCPSTDRKHFQCYVIWKPNFKKTLSANAKYFGSASQMANGSPDQNRVYCGAEDYEKDGKTKDANPLFQEFGELPRQGQRSDLDEIKDDIMQGKTSVDDVAINNPIVFHQYGRTLNKIEDIVLRKRFRNWMTTAEWLYGATGVGKSKKAFEKYSPDTHYVYPNDNGWWDGYAGQEIVIINEFRGEIKFSELLDLIDRYPKTVRRRGREPVPFLAKHIIITSCKKPSEIYSNALCETDNISQLLRRCKVTLMC